MTLYGYDISSYQGSNFDFDTTVSGGFKFCMLKATEGDYYIDPTFASNLSAARAAGLYVMAYVFLNGNALVEGHMQKVRDTIPKDCAIMLDVEPVTSYSPPSYPSVNQAEDLYDALTDEGWSVKLNYLPHWYWSGHLGSPDLTGLPPLAASAYVGGSGYASALYPGDSDNRWNSYGGQEVVVWQFTSSAVIASQGNVDADAFRGTQDELEELFDPERGIMATQSEKIDYIYSRMVDIDGNSNSNPYRYVAPYADDGNGRALSTLLQSLWNYDYQINVVVEDNASAISQVLGAIQQLASGSGITIDYDQIIQGVIAGIDPAEIASQVAITLGDDEAKAVADEIYNRLES